MILDIAEIEPGAVLRGDICIVGGGAAGIAMALALEGSGRRVILLEAGGMRAERETQALAAGELAPGSRHPPPHRYRPRRLGGATTLWGGRCMPLDPIDFARRDWVPHSGWPIGPDDLAPWYPAANALCEAGDFAYAGLPGMPQILAGFAGADFTDDAIERFSCPTDFAARYRARLAADPDLRVVLHANVTRIALSPDGALVRAITARDLGGRAVRVVCRDTVLAAGGLEVARLLLASRDRHAKGIGNAHGQVGRYYMCHLAGTLGRVRPAVTVAHGYTLSDEGIYCRRRFALTAAAQRRLRIGNMVARLHHPRIADPSHGSGALSALLFAAPFVTPEYATRLRDGAAAGWANRLRHAANIAATPRHTAQFLAHWLARRTLAARKYPSIVVRPPAGIYSLDIHAEQAPNPDSRVTLSAETDALGVPMPRVDWRHTELDVRTVRLGLRALAADLAAGGTAALDWDEATLEADLLRDGAYGGHHIGTARMSADPRHGVVDAECRVHGIANLWIAGSAVFPTSGQANPTLTLVALALRLAARLVKEGRGFAAEPHQGGPPWTRLP